MDDNEGGLEYANQSGALDESFADIFGHFVDSGDWLIGEGTPNARAPVTGRAGCDPTPSMRDMADPPCRRLPDRFLDHAPFASDPDPDANDNGNVHTNSSIHNKAAFPITAGGTYNGRTVRGLGQSKAQRLFYAVLTAYFWDSSRMIDARHGAAWCATYWGSADLHGFNLNDLCQVRNAYASVGLGQGDDDCDGREDGSDSDADGDAEPDDSDNCPGVDNPGQWDWDGDGVSNEYDEDERGRVYESLRENNTLTPRAPLRLPIPACPQRGEVIPNGHEEVIIVEVLVGFDVRLVDSEGVIVTDGVRGAARHVLRFRPPPHGSSAPRTRSFVGGQAGGAAPLAGGAAVPRRLPLDKPAPDELRYYLVVTPPPRADVRRGYRVSFRLDRGPRTRPGPVVRPTPVRPR